MPPWPIDRASCATSLCYRYYLPLKKVQGPDIAKGDAMDSYPRYLRQVGVRSAARAEFPDQFIGQQIFPLSVRKTRQVRAAEHKVINLERDFFSAESLIFGSVTLKGFKIIDWFPRTPGVFWSQSAIKARDSVYANSPQYDPKLGNFYTPQSKLSLIEYGGVGTIRLRPRRMTR